MSTSEDLLQVVTNLLIKSPLSQIAKCPPADALKLESIPADGSTRFFFRVTGEKDSTVCVGVFPSTADDLGMAEARAAVAIGNHLYGKNVAVPQINAADRKTGTILFEDCGNTSLHKTAASVVGRHSPQDESRLFLLYSKVLINLAYMQVHGRDGFQKSWCWDTGEYDKKLMVHRESGYFYDSFWKGLLGGHNEDGIWEEFDDIAERAASGLTGFFLHRDFQSRNILFLDQQPKFIDFQGGRLGPPGYDLASLLIDPYVGLSEEVQLKLLEFYLSVLSTHIDFEEDIFLKQYSYLRLQRNLQILGAFAFLYKRRKKPFFREYLDPSLDSLARLLSADEMKQYRRLRKLVDNSREKLKRILAKQ